MNLIVAQRIADNKPETSEHIFIDEDEIVRDKHIENMFRDLFTGQSLDDLFTNNFQVYHRMLTKSRKPIPAAVFTDLETATAWVSQHYGILHMFADDNAAHHFDPGEENEHCTHCTVIRSKYAPELAADNTGAYAPSALYSVLLAALLVMRAAAHRHLNAAFAEATA